MINREKNYMEELYNVFLFWDLKREYSSNLKGT